MLEPDVDRLVYVESGRTGGGRHRGSQVERDPLVPWRWSWTDQQAAVEELNPVCGLTEREVVLLGPGQNVLECRTHRPPPGITLAQGYSGMLPCFFGGRVSRLVRSARSALTTCARV